MADVFVSYARADEARVEHIVRALSDAGFSVWWDRSLEPGTNWPDIIDRELRRARCVVVVFSARSAASRWVSIEAHEARRRGILVPVVVERLELADEFASVQRLEWLSPDDAGAAKRLVAQVRKLTRRHRRRRALATAAVIAAFAAGVWFFVRGPDDEVAPAAAAVAIPEHSVAILPFEQEGLGDAPDLGEAIAIDLLESLARVQGLRVAAQVASWTAASEPVEGIRERLKVAWLVEGNLAPASAGHLRVRVRLVDTATGYVRKTWDVVTGEDELGGLTVTLVRHLIRVIPGAAAADVAIAVPGVDGDAYRYYLLARALLSEGRSPVDRVRAESYLEESVALQPDFAPAHAGLCEVRLWRYEVNHDPLDLDRADARCRKAAALAPEDPLVVLATAQLQAARGEHTSAVRRLQALLEHDPADAAARGALARSLAALRRNDDAEQEFLRVVREQPGHWGAHSAYGGFLLSEGRTDEAVRQFVLALDLAPEDPIALSNLGGALLATAELQGAIRAFRRSLAVAETAAALSNLGSAYYYANRLEEAADAFERATSLVPNDFRFWSNLADARAALGDPAAAAAYREAERLALALAKRNSDPAARVGLEASRAALGRGSLANLQSALEGAPLQWETHYYAALAFDRLGEADRAKDQLRQAVETGFPASLARRDPLLAGLTSPGDVPALGGVAESTPKQERERR